MSKYTRLSLSTLMKIIENKAPRDSKYIEEQPVVCPVLNRSCADSNI